MLNLFVLDAQSDKMISACVDEATAEDLGSTMSWQTVWTTEAATQMPNKVALRRTDRGICRHCILQGKDDGIVGILYERIWGQANRVV